MPLHFSRDSLPATMCSTSASTMLNRRSPKADECVILQRKARAELDALIRSMDGAVKDRELVDARDILETASRIRDLACREGVGDGDQPRRGHGGRLISSMVIVLAMIEAIILFGLYCFTLGYSLGKQSCGQSEVDSSLHESSYSYERISPEDWKTRNCLQRSSSDQSSITIAMIDEDQHSKRSEEQTPLSVAKSDNSKYSGSLEANTTAGKTNDNQQRGITRGSELSQDEPNESLPPPEELVDEAQRREQSEEILSLLSGKSSESKQNESPEDQTAAEKVDESQQRRILDSLGSGHHEPNDEDQQSKESEEQLPLAAEEPDDSEVSQSPEGQTATKDVAESQETGITDGSELRHDEPYHILPLPEEWEIYSFVEIHRHFDCHAHALDQSKPLHSLEQWRYMREKYCDVVDDSAAFSDTVPPTAGYALSDGTPPPYYAKFSPGRGRGIFASRDISKGELVHDGERSAVAFPDAAAWRRYTFALPPPMACDIAEWSWTQRLKRFGRLQVLVDLNIAAFFNGGGGGESNVMPRGRTGLKFFATRNIEKDSELLYDCECIDAKDVIFASVSGV